MRLIRDGGGISRTRPTISRSAASSSVAALPLDQASSDGWRDSVVKLQALVYDIQKAIIVQELCESRGGRPGLSVLTSLLVSEDVKL